MLDSQINITLGTYKRYRIIAIGALDSIVVPLKIVNQSVLGIISAIYTMSCSKSTRIFLIATQFFVFVKAVRVLNKHKQTLRWIRPTF